ncbi:murein transglycosylase A [Trinickia dinghuensis]|uniref:peptidoglycan lytic exotransglycosylase n=1 Tax=Trinickia dinghuensis TaxID=2291023 RepID=A0A3D8JR95_9BURK|nr:MltA domain-containing protein [Trinickia dinghuensis]RDU95420.1 murein transglycosylase [Trinickia dinghuensis]
MITSNAKAASASSAKISIGYSFNRADMAISIKSEHCMRIPSSFLGRVAALAAAVLLAACGGGAIVRPAAPPGGVPSVTGALSPGRLTQVAWQQVPGWADDSLIGAAAALRENCLRVGQLANWRRACAAASQLDDLDATATRSFFETYFTPFQLANSDGSVDGLVTGYYEPLLHGARTRRGPYQYPLYHWPSGYRPGTALPPRAELERSGLLQGNELVWVDDPIEAFFLQVQGSGRIVLDDGGVMRVGFGGTNNQPYRSIGRWLLDHGEITPAQATMQGIKAWARANPARLTSLLDVNPRFVFFRDMPPTQAASDGGDGPIGALGVPLTPERSIAVDPSSIPLGTPVFLATTRPFTNTPMNRLVFAQDTGSAIRGGVRADYFWGLGDDAGDLAGKMKQAGRMWLLLPNS